MGFLRKLSIRSQLLILAVTTVVAILIVILHSYSMMSSMITRSHEEYVKQTVPEIEKNVSSNKDVIYRLMQSISYNEDVQSYLVEQDSLVRFEKFKKLNLLLSSQKELKDGILDIVISGNNGSWIDLNGGNPYVSAKKELLKEKVNGYYVGMERMDNLYGSPNALIFATTISYKKQGELFNQNIGALFFIIDPRSLVGDQKDTLAPAQTGTQIYVLDKDDRIITSNVHAETGSRLSAPILSGNDSGDNLIRWNDKQYVVQKQELPEVGGTILSMAPKDELLRDLLDIRKKELLVLGLCLLLLAIPFTFIMNNILRPLKKMIFFMTTAKKGDLLTMRKRLSLHGYMEISIMAAEFNSLLDEAEQLSQRLLEANTRLYGIELEKKKAELAFLRSQINPHFLYNTLEAITGIAVVEKQTKIKTMTRALSSIFRYSIKGADTVRLAEEVRMIESYIQIQQIRFADRFSVRYELPEEALNFRIPKMILQPLVENAIYHGLEPSENKGLLVVRAEVANSDKLEIIVEDDGVGMSLDSLQCIKSSLALPSGEQSQDAEHISIGLANVHNRIQLIYGSGSGLQIESSPDNGTVVRLTIAERREPDV